MFFQTVKFSYNALQSHQMFITEPPQPGHLPHPHKYVQTVAFTITLQNSVITEDTFACVVEGKSSFDSVFELLSKSTPNVLYVSNTLFI